MKSARVQLFGFTGKYATVNLDATEGATVGLNLRWADGTLVTEQELRGSSSESPDLSTTDDLDEGRYNLFFTDRRAQDAVGAILADSSDIDFSYNPGTSISATLTDTGVAGGSYGDESHVPRITVDEKGRVTDIEIIEIEGGFVPYLVPAGTVFRVPANKQALWTIPIELEGDASLEIDGALVEVA